MSTSNSKTPKDTKHIVIVGAGFAGLAVAKKLAGNSNYHVTVVDKRNHHLFQPLLYQVAMAALSPAEIAVPIRALLSNRKNTRIVREFVQSVDLERRVVQTDVEAIDYDYLVLACGSQHSYFGREEWESHAPGLKTLPQATEIRRRVLTAFENAETTQNKQEQREHLTFVIVGGGPTGVELAGAIGEMSRFTLAKDFLNIDPTSTRIILIEAGTRILASFQHELAAKAARELEQLGVQMWLNARVTKITEQGVHIGDEFIASRTVLWAAGVAPSPVNATLNTQLDDRGRVIVKPTLNLAKYPEVFVAGDQARCDDSKGRPLPGLAPVAKQQGQWIAKQILRVDAGKNLRPFRYVDKGQMATIGRDKAIAQIGKLTFSGWFAWIIWLVIHIYYLCDFRNRITVILRWALSYFGFNRGARLIVSKNWRTYSEDEA